ncbi:hypothetical protein [Bacillus sp. CGMCC 1.16541]|uniref:hypothetical protein n=1 Tax=Bacillus sp. CGMCC 1.16541 TaxID=2185143 RepID=UPI000D73C933|nr:hypothetical protein [Bacillus sp. CGMCC 1.16541]
MKRAFVLFIALSSTLISCSNDKPVTQNVTSEEKCVEVVEQVNEKKPFSYLQDLSDEKRAIYDQFVHKKEVHLLKNFTPEEILLVYLHSAGTFDNEAIYELTYNRTLFGDFHAFQVEYQLHLSSSIQDMAMTYRFYDTVTTNHPTIKPAEPLKEGESKVVITTSYGSSMMNLASVMLIQEDGVWKVDTNSMLLYYKNKESETTE